MMKQRIDAVVFDLDGVLIDSADAHFQSWRRLAAELEQTVTEEQFKETFGRQNRDIIPLLSGVQDDDERICALSERKEAYYRELITEKVPVISGATKLVRDCQAAGLRCAIGSSGHPLNIALAVRGLNIEAEIQAIVSGDDVTIGKPDPQVFLLAAERLGVRPDRCAVVEDAPAGVEAALRAGMTAIAITTGHDRRKLQGAHLIVDSLGELSPDRIRACRR